MSFGSAVYSPGTNHTVQVSKWFRLALFNFLLAASIGVLLRFAFVDELKWLNYKAFQNAHSHLALLGWGYLALFALLLSAFAEPDVITKKKYRVLYAVSAVTILLISAGFAVLSNKLIPDFLLVILSFLIFAFAYNFIKDTKARNAGKVSYQFACVALVFLCLSFIGTYVLIPSLIVSGAKKILLYYLSSQFFLHFQYNGWFTFAVLALLLRLAEEKKVPLDQQKNRRTLYILSFAALLTFFLSLFWGDQKRTGLLAIASSGGILQLGVIIGYSKYFYGIYKAVTAKLNKKFRLLIVISLTCFLLKILMQVIIIVPFIATLAFTIRNYVIAYIHLVFIGMVSLFLFAWAVEHGFLTIVRTVRVGIYSLVTGFILVELVLFVQGTLLWMGMGFISFYYPLLFLVSVLLPLGLLIITIKNLKYLPFNNQLQ